MTHPLEGFWLEQWEKSEDVGGGVRISYYTVQGSDVRAGCFIRHLHDNGELCTGSVMFDIPETAHHKNTKWQLISREPLHIEPSILQKPCGLHGFIRNGRWENC